jgi:hypothetical protein
MNGIKEIDPQAEARRQLQNHQFSHDELNATRDGYLANDIREGAYERIVLLLGDASRNMLVLGQAHYVLDGNVSLGRSTFAELGTWSRWLDTLLGKHKNVWPDGDFELLLEPVLCYLLAGDWHSLARIAQADIATSVKVSSKRRPRLAFTLDLVRLLRLDGPPARSVDPTPIPDKFHFAGYDVLLRAIASGDAAAFESQRTKLEAAFPARARERESALDWSGSGKVAQAATFDAQGTALCALAVKRGLPVNVDSRLYPRAFIQET